MGSAGRKRAGAGLLKTMGWGVGEFVASGFSERIRSVERTGEGGGVGGEVEGEEGLLLLRLRVGNGNLEGDWGCGRGGRCLGSADPLAPPAVDATAAGRRRGTADCGTAAARGVSSNALACT